MTAALVTPVAAFLREELGEALVAGFVYGSVAAGRTHPGSDIDCFVLTACELTGVERRRVGTRFAELQRRLMFQPDPDHPIELFSVDACESALRSPLLDRALRDAVATGTINPWLAESDAVEVLRALLDRRLILHPAPELNELSSRAETTLCRHPQHTARLRRALNLAGDGR